MPEPHTLSGHEIAAALCELPRPESHYASLPPFDPDFVFTDQAGAPWRYLRDPLDGEYLVEPADRLCARALPPEDFEVRDHLFALILLYSRLGFLDIILGFIRPSAAYLAAAAMHDRLAALASKSPAHRAAMCRLAKGREMPLSGRKCLEEILRKKY